jgi:hypothetical protein
MINDLASSQLQIPDLITTRKGSLCPESNKSNNDSAYVVNLAPMSHIPIP